jgi:putative aminopeptidase FrvX
MADLPLDLPFVLDFLTDLLNIHSPTGYTQDAIDFAQQAFDSFSGSFDGYESWKTRKGALIIKIPGETADNPIALTGHVDTLGLLVREIKSDGRMTVSKLGGILLPGAENEGVTMRTFDDQRIRGTLVPVNTSTHVNIEIHRSERNETTMEVRLDARTSSKKETEALGVSVGDFIFIDPRVERTEAGFFKSRFLDDKAGVACMLGALKSLADAGLKPPQDTYLLISNYEEVGHGGSNGLPDDLAELLVVDMGAIGIGQNSDEFSVSICIKDAGGPYHFEMNRKLRQLAIDHDIPYKTDLYINYSSDGTAYWRSGGGARVGLAGPGIAASHSYERTHEDSIRHTTHLLARYMLNGVE